MSISGSVSGGQGLCIGFWLESKGLLAGLIRV